MSRRRRRHGRANGLAGRRGRMTLARRRPSLSFRPDARITPAGRVRAGPLRRPACPRCDRRAQRRVARARAAGAGRIAGRSWLRGPSRSAPGSAATRMGGPISAGGTRCATGSNRSAASSPASWRSCPSIRPRPSRAGSCQAARAAVERQLALAPPLASKPSLEALRDFALVTRQRARDGPAGRRRAHRRARSRAGRDGRRRSPRDALPHSRPACVAHGVSIALPHFRLNASQLHNAMRRTIGLEGEPTEPAQRRAFLAAVNGALDNVEAVAVDFGALAAERASATRMLMTIAQIVKHLDSSRPVRFLVAETETGYTLLSALWLARRFGVADQVEISPLFETAEALEQGPRVIDEALRSPHWRNYLRRHGRFCIQFGYSDSGRYIGQIAASFWIERLRAAYRSNCWSRYDLDGRRARHLRHARRIVRPRRPSGQPDRPARLSGARRGSRRVFARAGIGVVRESSFQGSDGYLLVRQRCRLPERPSSRIAESRFRSSRGRHGRSRSTTSRISRRSSSGRCARRWRTLVDDPGYAALIGTFGPSLLDTTGSRPAARQIEGAAAGSDQASARAARHPEQRHPAAARLARELLHGLGHAASRAPDLFRAMRQRSDRFERAYRLAEHAMASSDLDVIRAYVDTLDPGSWFDRARRTEREGRRDELLAVAGALERLDLAPALRRLFGRFATDWLKLKAVSRRRAAHVGRGSRRCTRCGLTIIHRIWLVRQRTSRISGRRTALSRERSPGTHPASRHTGFARSSSPGVPLERPTRPSTSISASRPARAKATPTKRCTGTSSSRCAGASIWSARSRAPSSMRSARSGKQPSRTALCKTPGTSIGRAP